jgi:serpin B
MTSSVETANHLRQSAAWLRKRRKEPAHATPLFVEELEPRCVLSGAVVPNLPPLALEQAAGRSIDALAQDLYSLLQRQSGGSGNMILSPLSIATALAMTDAGARGETASQIASVLHAANVDPNTLAKEFGGLLTDLNGAGQGQITLALADALWGQQGFPFNQAFLNLVQADYGGALHQVDFAQNTAALQTINDWVAQQTAGKIQNLFSSLSPTDRLVLTNAIYFNGNWANPFKPGATFPAAFTLFSAANVQASTMHETANFDYMDGDGYQVLEMPYVGGRIAMDVILPGAGSGLQGLNVSQLPANLSAWLRGLSEQEVQVSLPKFDMTTRFDLSSTLKSLGMTDAFSNQANFSGIGPVPLKISAAGHEAFINVTETGTEAAAATGFGAEPTIASFSPTPTIVFNADHPFLFVIRDTQSGSVLFEGQVTDPTSEAADPTAPPISVIQTKHAPNSAHASDAPVPSPATAPISFQQTGQLKSAVGPISMAVSPPLASVPPAGTTYVSVVAPSLGDLSSRQHIIAASIHAAPTPQEDAPRSSSRRPAFARTSNGQGLTAADSMVFSDSREMENADIQEFGTLRFR